MKSINVGTALLFGTCLFLLGNSLAIAQGICVDLKDEDCTHSPAYCEDIHCDGLPAEIAYCQIEPGYPEYRTTGFQFHTVIYGLYSGFNYTQSNGTSTCTEVRTCPGGCQYLSYNGNYDSQCGMGSGAWAPFGSYVSKQIGVGTCF